MVRSVSAVTFELDDADVALREIREQIGDFVFGKSTVGIVQFGTEVLYSGVAQAVCAGIGFPVVGGTSSMQGSNGGVGEMGLSLLVLTSDDATFVPGHTSGIDGDLNAAVAAAYKEAATGDAPPKVVLAFPPRIRKYVGDMYMQAFESVCEGVPIFGTIAVGEDVFAEEGTATVCGGDVFKTEMSFVLVYGEVSPRFMIANISDEHALPASGVITKADGSYIREIDGQPAVRFFERIGLAKDGATVDTITYMPMVLRVVHADGSLGEPYTRGIFGADPDGSMHLTGFMYEKTALTVGTLSGADVVNTTMVRCDEINGIFEGGQVGAALLFTCFMRQLVCGSRPMAEAEKVRERLLPNVPFLLSSSGGEICPVGGESGELTSRFHNFTFIACLL